MTFEIVKKWANDNHVSTVNRSYGEQTTTPVSVAALENLVRAAVLAEREACAAICDGIHMSGPNGAGIAADKIRARSN